MALEDLEREQQRFEELISERNDGTGGAGLARARLAFGMHADGVGIVGGLGVLLLWRSTRTNDLTTEHSRRRILRTRTATKADNRTQPHT